MIKLNGKEVVFNKFPNGETRMETTGENSLRVGDKHQEILFKFEDDSDLIKLMFLKKYLDNMLFEKVVLFVTYMPYSRMDRSENHSPFTLEYVSDFIKNFLKFTHITVVEPHSDVTPALLGSCTSKYINFDLVERVKKMVGFDEDFDYLVFPDNGASKRYAKMKANNVLVGYKHRDFTTGEIQSLELIGDKSPYSKKAIIVDDLSSYGGTFVKTAEELRKFGINEIYLLTAHAENSIFKGELFENVTKVFTTDSILTEQNELRNKKFESQLHIFDIEGVLSND